MAKTPSANVSRRPVSVKAIQGYCEVAIEQG